MTNTEPAPRPGHTAVTPKKRKPVKLAAAAVGLFVLTLASCGTGMAIGSDPDATPQPTATETVEVPGPEKTVEVPGPERVVEKEVEVPVTPQACLDAIDLGEQGFDLASQTITIMQEALNAAASLDASGIDAARIQLEALQPELESIIVPMNEAKAECRAS